MNWLHRQIWYATHGDTKWRIPAIVCGAALILLALFGCGGTELVKRAEVQTVRVTWVKEKPESCGDASNADGCATRSLGYQECLIRMREDVSISVIAEEFLHCFGWEHK